ncbi:hypothetical protein KFU94_56640 [Chloroflexi bacterium TSY]|nr:hypothetical protein [Chloroflexi bacterium TSY]
MTPGQREFECRLPIGYSDNDGQVHRLAVLRKMRGHEEALLYDTSLTASQLVTKLLENCLVRLGDMAPVDAETMAQLYTADRNYLLLELRRITLGDRLPALYRCPQCGHDISVIDDLSQIDIRRLDDGQILADIDVMLEDGYLDREGTLHTELVLTLPLGSDEEFVAPMVAKDPLKAQDALILRCIKQFGTLSKAAMEAYGVKILRDLTLGDRLRIHQALNDNTPGVNFQRSIQCERCGAVFDGVMDVSSFFVMS